MGEEKLLIIGSGGLGREVAAFVTGSDLGRKYHLLGFIDDGMEAGTLIHGLPVLGGKNYFDREKEEVSIAIAVGDPLTRKNIYEQLQKHKNLKFPTLVHPDARVHQSQYVQWGRGNIICDGNIFTTDVQIGDFNLINLSCTIGHDVIIGNFCSVMPGVNISGGAHIEDLVYIGTGAKLIKASKVGTASVVGAGAVVNTNVEGGKTYVGIPAKKIN